MKAQVTLSLTKIKQWYLPFDAETYKIMRDQLGLPVTRIHQNLFPILHAAAKKHKMEIRGINFIDDILNPYLDKLGTTWLKREHRTATLNGSVLKFETTNSKVKEQGVLAINKLEGSLRRFFERWGYKAVFEYSEARGKCKLHVKYKFNSEQMQVIPLVEPNEALPTVRLKLGFVKLTLILGPKSVEVNYAIAAGTGWTSMHTSTCLYSQISDVRPMMRALVDVTNREPYNDEISVDN